MIYSNIAGILLFHAIWSHSKLLKHLNYLPNQINSIKRHLSSRSQRTSSSALNKVVTVVWWGDEKVGKTELWGWRRSGSPRWMCRYYPSEPALDRWWTGWHTRWHGTWGDIEHSVAVMSFPGWRARWRLRDTYLILGLQCLKNWRNLGIMMLRGLFRASLSNNSDESSQIFCSAPKEPWESQRGCKNVQRQTNKGNTQIQSTWPEVSVCADEWIWPHRCYSPRSWVNYKAGATVQATSAVPLSTRWSWWGYLDRTTKEIMALWKRKIKHHKNVPSALPQPRYLHQFIHLQKSDSQKLENIHTTRIRFRFLAQAPTDSSSDERRRVSDVVEAFSFDEVSHIGREVLVMSLHVVLQNQTAERPRGFI